VTVLAGEDDATFTGQRDRGNRINWAGKIKVRALDAFILKGIQDHPGIRVIEEHL
jgi:hypothetical protein